MYHLLYLSVLKAFRRELDTIALVSVLIENSTWNATVVTIMEANNVYVCTTQNDAFNTEKQFVVCTLQAS